MRQGVVITTRMRRQTRSFWFERSPRTANFTSNANWGWICCAIAKNLQEVKEPHIVVVRGEVRALLGVIGVDQVSLDSGSRLMAWPLQPHKREPPYQSFVTHSASTSRIPYSELYDLRWMEVVQGHLHEVEAMLERWTRLIKSLPQGPPPSTGEPNNTPPTAPRRRGGGKSPQPAPRQPHAPPQ